MDYQVALSPSARAMEEWIMGVDEIVEETRKARAEYAAEFEYDIAAIVADVKEKEKLSERPVVSRPPKPVAVPLAKAS